MSLQYTIPIAAGNAMLINGVPVQVAANKATLILPTRYNGPKKTFLSRKIQNTSNTSLFLSVGQLDQNGGPIADGIAVFNVVLNQFAIYDASKHKLPVCGWSAAASVVAIEEIILTDFSN